MLSATADSVLQPVPSTASSPKVIAFDAYGTLFDVMSLTTWCEARFPGKGESICALWREKQLQYTWLRSLMGHYEDFWQITVNSLLVACKQHGIDLAEADCRELMEGYLTLSPYSEVAAVLNTLSERYRLTILSNGTPEMLLKVVQYNQMGGYFVELLSAHETSTYKPSPAVYTLLTDAFQIETHEVLFVSSNGWDALGAKAFGFQTVWVNRKQQAVDALGTTPDHEITNLQELLPLLSLYSS